MEIVKRLRRLSGTPAEAGVRGVEHFSFDTSACLSGTPAEAGVREAEQVYQRHIFRLSQWNPCRSRGARLLDEVIPASDWKVSVEPLPKQGCEWSV